MPGVKQSDLISLELDKDAVPAARIHEEQSVQYTHEMPYDLQESIGRVIIRIVPLLYGGMFGSLLDELPMALTVGAVVSAGMDLAMGNQSILLSLGRPFFIGGCPLIALLARNLAGGISALGLRAPGALSNMRCGASGNGPDPDH